MKAGQSMTKRIKIIAAIILALFIVAAAAIARIQLCDELYVIGESLTLEVHTAYGTFSGVAVGPHLILTVAHGAELPGEKTLNHYKVFKVWSDEDADLALLRTEERFYLYSDLLPNYPLTRVTGRDLCPGDSGTAIVNNTGAVCFLLKGYDHTTGQYAYVPVTREAVEAIQIFLDDNEDR